MLTNEKVVSIICRQFKIDEDIVNMSTDIMDDLKADSLDVVELVMAFEEESGMIVPDEDVMELKTVGAICAYIEKRMGM